MRPATPWTSSKSWRRARGGRQRSLPPGSSPTSGASGSRESRWSAPYPTGERPNPDTSTSTGRIRPELRDAKGDVALPGKSARDTAGSDRRNHSSLSTFLNLAVIHSADGVIHRNNNFDSNIREGHDGCRVNGGIDRDVVSIRAPVKGATSSIPEWVRPAGCAATRCGSCFNPRTREGCDAALPGLMCVLLRFNPRTREGCDGLSIRQQLYS